MTDVDRPDGNADDRDDLCHITSLASLTSLSLPVSSASAQCNLDPKDLREMAKLLDAFWDNSCKLKNKRVVRKEMFVRRNSPQWRFGGHFVHANYKTKNSKFCWSKNIIEFSIPELCSNDVS